MWWGDQCLPSSSLASGTAKGLCRRGLWVLGTEFHVLTPGLVPFPFSSQVRSRDRDGERAWPRKAQGQEVEQLGDQSPVLGPKVFSPLSCGSWGLGCEIVVLFETERILSTTAPHSQKPQTKPDTDSNLAGYHAFDRNQLSKICSYLIIRLLFPTFILREAGSLRPTQ